MVGAEAGIGASAETAYFSRLQGIQDMPMHKAPKRSAMSAVIAAHPSDVSKGASTIAESTRGIVSRCQKATSVFIRCVILIHGNWKIGRELDHLRGLISQLTVEDHNDRRRLLDPAKRLGESSREWEKMHGEWVSRIRPQLPGYIPLIDLFGTKIADQLEERAGVTEDLAETLALAASEPFAKLVRQELDAERVVSARRHETL